MEFQVDRQKKDGLACWCKKCKAEKSKEYISKIPDSYRKYQAQWQRENREKCNANSAKWKEKNPEKVKALRERRKSLHIEYKKAWRIKNAERAKATDDAWKEKNPERLKLYKKTYGIRHPERNLEMNARRRAARRKAIPAWANKKYIAMFYEMAKQDTIATGIKMVVDHIVPLRSEFVCGLHCEDNLQVLTKKENAKKNNKWWPDMWEKV